MAVLKKTEEGLLLVEQAAVERHGGQDAMSDGSLKTEEGLLLVEQAEECGGAARRPRC